MVLLLWVAITCFEINGAMIEEQKHALLQSKWWNISNIPYNLSDPCNWKGVTCDSHTKRVIYL